MLGVHFEAVFLVVCLGLRLDLRVNRFVVLSVLQDDLNQQLDHFTAKTAGPPGLNYCYPLNFVALFV